VYMLTEKVPKLSGSTKRMKVVPIMAYIIVMRMTRKNALHTAGSD
jgi:hypothetical protein